MEVSAINLSHFGDRDFASYKSETPQPTGFERPVLSDIDIIWEQDVHKMTTSFYHTQNNGKVKRLHKTKNDILAKKIWGNERSWDLYVNQLFSST